MRVYALYHRNRRVLIFLVVSGVAATVYGVVRRLSLSSWLRCPTDRAVPQWVILAGTSRDGMEHFDLPELGCIRGLSKHECVPPRSCARRAPR